MDIFQSIHLCSLPYLCSPVSSSLCLTSVSEDYTNFIISVTDFLLWNSLIQGDFTLKVHPASLHPGRLFSLFLLQAPSSEKIFLSLSISQCSDILKSSLFWCTFVHLFWELEEMHWRTQGEENLHFLDSFPQTDIFVPLSQAFSSNFRPTVSGVMGMFFCLRFSSYILSLTDSECQPHLWRKDYLILLLCCIFQQYSSVGKNSHE